MSRTVFLVHVCSRAKDLFFLQFLCDSHGAGTSGTHGVPYIPFVEQIFERHQLVALTAVGIYVVVDGDVPDVEHGEPLFNVQPSVKLVSA